MADIERGNSTATIKRIIGIILLLIGAYVTYDGYANSDTLALVTRIAALLGGLAFLFIRPRRVV